VARKIRGVTFEENLKNSMGLEFYNLSHRFGYQSPNWPYFEDVKIERIHYFASREYELSAAGITVLNGWLTKRPSHTYISEGLHDILLLAQASDDMEVDFSELPALLSYAEGIARSTAVALDHPGAVSVAADKALEEIARELHIDHGESWAERARRPCDR